VINAEGEEEIGFHDGAVFHTLGERHGFTITKKSPNDGPYYIVCKDVKKNILFVSHRKNYLEKSTDIFLLKNSSCSRQSRSQVSFQDNSCFTLKDTNWISKIPESNKIYTAQIRYHGEFLLCKIKCARLRLAQVIFNKPVLVASGQSCVIYDDDVCLGGGVVVDGLPYINSARTTSK
jgi:tRNA-specific 2-thiouridylase